MNNMRRGFTMIELIFVIVIIGILAAVAIPKLAATRDDAKVSNIVANTRTGLGDLTSKYTALGRTTFALQTVQAVTNIPFETACAAGQFTNEVIAGESLFLCDGATECVRFDVDDNATQVLIVSTTSTDQESPVCKGVFEDPAVISMAGAVSGTGKPHIFGGSTVQR